MPRLQEMEVVFRVEGGRMNFGESWKCVDSGERLEKISENFRRVVMGQVMVLGWKTGPEYLPGW